MSSVKEIIEHLTEGDDDFSVKDVTHDPSPRFEFRIHDLEHAGSSFDVFVDGKWIGIIGKISDSGPRGGRVWPDPRGAKWEANWLPEMPEHPHPDSFNTAVEAAQWLWDHRQYQTVWKMESEVVTQVIESDEGVSAPTPVKLAASELMDAGFNVTKAEENEKGWLLECNWLAPSNKTFIAGAQRVKEVVGKHLKESVASTQRKGQKMEIRLWHTSQKEN